MSWPNEEDRSDEIQRGNSWSEPRSLIIIFVRLVRALSRARRAFLKDPRPTCGVGVLEFSSVFILFCFSLATIVLGRNLGSNAGEKDFKRCQYVPPKTKESKWRLIQWSKKTRMGGISIVLAVPRTRLYEYTKVTDNRGGNRLNHWIDYAAKAWIWMGNEHTPGSTSKSF